MKKSGSRPKTKTFTGCWTCRARKIKCDLGRPSCGCCRKSGLSCRGYSIPLHWVHDNDAVSPSFIRRQARSLAFGNPHWSVGSLRDVDEHLQDVEQHGKVDTHEHYVSGPFGVFHQRCEPAESSQHAQTLALPGLTLSSLVDEDLAVVEVVQEESSEDSERACDIDLEDESVDVDTVTVRGRVAPESVVQHSSSLELWTALDASTIATISQHDILVDKLMTHYLQNVATILQPVIHPRNAYSSIYATEAMSVARRISWRDVFQHTGVSNVVSNSKLALLCSLLTSSSFHLRGSGQFDDADAMARYFRIKAMNYLRLALSSGYTAVGSSANPVPMLQSISNPESVLSVILTLVTADVMDGQMTEFWIHLDAAQALVTRLREKQQARPGSPAEHLINIYTFLRIMSDSTDVSTLLSPSSLRMGKSSAFLGGAHSLEFTYGITARLADLLRRTSRLAQARRYYRNRNQPEPADFLSARDDLLCDLMDWDIGQEPLPSFPARDDITSLLASTHMLAFASGIRVYFHARVFPCDEPKMQSLVQSVASHLTSLEAVKRRTAGYDATPTAAISWPGFIASCQASPPNRDVWTKWWIQMQDYHIGNLHTLWSVVQETWSWQDAGTRDDAPWTLVLERTGRRILAI